MVQARSGSVTRQRLAKNKNKNFRFEILHCRKAISLVRNNFHNFDKAAMKVHAVMCVADQLEQNDRPN